MTEGLFDKTLPHDTRHALFSGRGSVRVWNLVSRPEAPFAAMLACELEPGGSVGTHVQEHFPEIVIVVSGHGIARVNDEPCELRPGSVVELPLGKTLSLENGSLDQPLGYLIIKAIAT
jgi:quercetin dioxygenase-like cupin family protein